MKKSWYLERGSLLLCTRKSVHFFSFSSSTAEGSSDCLLVDSWKNTSKPLIFSLHGTPWMGGDVRSTPPPISRRNDLRHKISRVSPT